MPTRAPAHQAAGPLQIRGALATRYADVFTPAALTALELLAPDRARAVRGHLAGLDAHELMQLYGWSYQRTRNLVARGMADLRDALRARGVA